jgi:hypothetical protein
MTIARLEQIMDTSDAEVGDIFIDAPNAIAIVKQVRRLGDTRSISMGLKLVRNEGKWQIADFDPLPDDKAVTAYLDDFRARSVNPWRPAKLP